MNKNAPGDIPRLKPLLRLLDDAARDQDDMCIWIHPDDPAASRIITSDKKAEHLFVYDLQGRTMQSVATPKPGNIDIRYNVPLGGESVDLVAFNQRRDENLVKVFVVDPADGTLRRVDDGSIVTEPGYGSGLFKSAKDGRLYFIKTFKDQGMVEQLELYDGGDGTIQGDPARSWHIGQCEGVAAHDASGRLFISEEKLGIWALGGEPEAPSPGELVARVGENGLAADVEGMAVLPLSESEGYLLVSNQGVDNFHVYRFGDEFEFIGAFAIEGAEHTDGIAVSGVALGDRFPNGIFTCHTVGAEGNVKRCPVLVASWKDIADALGIDPGSSLDPRV
jgi:3-phytase